MGKDDASGDGAARWPHRRAGAVHQRAALQGSTAMQKIHETSRTIDRNATASAQSRPHTSRPRRLALAALALAITVGLAAPASAGTMFQGTMFQGTMFQGTMFQGTMFQGTMFQGTMFQGTMFQGTMFQGTLFQGTLFQGTTFQGTTLKALAQPMYLRLVPPQSRRVMPRLAGCSGSLSVPSYRPSIAGSK
jgi:uncharacterized protein YjbI with pentapeptide repeats